VSKSRHTKYRDYDYENEGFSKNRNQNNQRRDKRINNALRSKNIDILYSLDNEE